jgi:hypothetical protein
MGNARLHDSKRRTAMAWKATNLAVKSLAVSLFCLLLIWPALAGAEFMIYPAKGQSQDQQTRDKGECHQWAVQNSGVDPAALAAQAPPSTAPQGQEKRHVLRGAAGGAAIGALGGSMGGEAGKGAAVGAGAGVLVGAARKRRAAKQQTQQQQQATQQHQQNTKAQLDKYNRAYKACLEGRGYSVK